MATLASGWLKVQEHAAVDDFERLFQAEYSRVVAIAYRVLGDAHGAEDVAQEVFCSFYRLHNSQVPFAAAWLHRAAAHTALNVIRGTKRRQQREHHAAIQRDRLLEPAEAALDPQQALEESEQRREVRVALARLPEKTAAVLALRYSGLSYAEVAGALNVKVGQVGTLLRRAESALRKEMHHATPR